VRIFLRIFISFCIALLAGIAISPLVLPSISRLPDNRLEHLPLSELHVCAKNAVASYEAGGPQTLHDHKPDCYNGLLLSSDGVVLADPPGRKLSPIELSLVKEAEGGGKMIIRTLPINTYVAFPVGEGSDSSYIYLATVPPANRALFWSRVIRLGRLVLIAGLFSGLLTAYLVRPITRLSYAAEQFGKGDLKARVHPSLSKRKDELGELGRTFDQMAANTESLVDRYRVFLAHASHELGSPLTRLNIALAIAKRNAGSQLERELSRIGCEANRLNDLVRELLLLARLESGNELSRDRVAFDVAVLVDEACADASFEAEQLSKSVVIVRREQFHLHGHRDLLRRAIDNVLRNGLRFAQTHGRVQVSYFCKDGLPAGVILIEDDGPGIPAGQEEAIFEPFVTIPGGDSEAKAGGSGLGLAIARQAVLANDGKIYAKSGADGGLIVTIELPTVMGILQPNRRTA
jgi:two-component system, OmpR family, sensor histidine kinase CpxA